MSVVNVTLGDGKKLNLPLGRQGENEVTAVAFDFSAWSTEFGSGTLSLSVQRHGDELPYAVTMTTAGTVATWTISDLDTAYRGTGEAQVKYTVGTKVKKSAVYKFTVNKSLGQNGEYPSPGQTWQEEIEDELADVKQDLSNIITIEKIGSYNIEAGKYYSTSSGEKASSALYSCTKELIDVRNIDLVGSFWWSETDENIIVTCYDSTKTYIRYIYAIKTGLASPQPVCIPPNTCYIALSVKKSSIDKLFMKKVPREDIIEYPFDTDGIVICQNYWVTNTGSFSSASTYNCILVADVKEGEKLYTNSTGSVAVIFFDASGTMLSYTASETLPRTSGKIFTAPANSSYAWINIQKSRTHGEDEYAVVLYRVTQSERILCIGDSITYLDGITSGNYDGATLFLGYQKQLEKAGYITVSAGYSGYTLATDVTSGGSAVGSIYTQIVTNEFDVSGYDVIVILGGTNDDLFGVPVGTAPSDYSATTFDTTTMAGALSGIINYIRANNAKCKIILCTQLKSQASARPYTEAETYADTIASTAKFASCFLCNTFENMNVQPFSTGWENYFYDGTHPNKAGMIRLGKLILNAVIQC